MTLNGVDISILIPAFLAGLLVLTTHVPLGQQVLARGIIFLDLAIAQIAALGVIIAYSLGWEKGDWEVQVTAISTALLGAGLLYLTEKLYSEVQEAIIGSIFVLAASAGMIALSASPQGGEQLKALLAGQILWVSYEQLLPVLLTYTAIVALWFSGGRDKHPLIFYGLFAISITLSVQLVGVYLVFASLIIPALAVRHATNNSLTIAYLSGGIGYAGGLVLSTLYDLPSGATIVWTLALSGIITAITIRMIQKKTGY